MKNTDKVTLTIGQLKRLIKENVQRHTTVGELVQYLNSLDPDMTVCDSSGFPVSKGNIGDIVSADQKHGFVVLG